MNAIVDAIDDSRRLVSWAEGNSLVLNDERAEAAVLRSFEAVPLDRNETGPMFRPCDPRRPATNLLDAIVTERREARAHCDRCAGDKPAHRLWVPCGLSVAELACCGHCRRVLDESFSGLVWR